MDTAGKKWGDWAYGRDAEGKPLPPDHQCTSKSKQSGERCKRQATPGCNVCNIHGGRTPNAVAAARARLLQAAGPAITRLLEIIESHPGRCTGCGHVDSVTGVKCEGCGRDTDRSATISAIRTLLDRCGLGPHSTVTVEPGEKDQLRGMSSDQLRARAQQILAMADYLETGGPAPDETEGDAVH
jgi:hypothetical protein